MGDIAKDLENILKEVKNLHSEISKDLFKSNHSLFDKYIYKLYSIEDDIERAKRRVENETIK